MGDLSNRIAELSEYTLGERGMLVRPIAFYDHVDRFDALTSELGPECVSHLGDLDDDTARRVATTYAFADELARDVLHGFCPPLSREAERPQRLLWAAAVLLDHLLDHLKHSPGSLEDTRRWLLERSEDPPPSDATVGQPPALDRAHQAFMSLMSGFLSPRPGGSDPPPREADERYRTDLGAMLDAELQSVEARLDQAPSERMRRVLYNKSVLLCRVGLQSCFVGRPSPIWPTDDWPRLCDAVGEIFWIMDDLADLEEDLDRGLWNRTLLALHDRLGAAELRHALASRSRLAAALEEARIVEAEIAEVERRIQLLETHPRVLDPSRLRMTLCFWVTSWARVYGPEESPAPSIVPQPSLQKNSKKLG